MIVYRCEDSEEGILTAVYKAYEDKCDHADTRLSLTQEYFLFAEHRDVDPDAAKAEKVIRTLRKRFGEEDYQRLSLCLTAPDERKAQAAYRTIVNGLSQSCRPGQLFDRLTDPDIALAFSLSRSAWYEMHHLYGFLRFAETKRGFLFAEISPKNNILVFLTAHFADRIPMENFIIYDEGRGLFGVHPAGKNWYLLRREEFSAEERKELRPSGREQEIQELFRGFCRSIAIQERQNLKLQQNLLPLRFRPYMTEFADK